MVLSMLTQVSSRTVELTEAKQQNKTGSLLGLTYDSSDEE
jgi:hypothetical protein